MAESLSAVLGGMAFDLIGLSVRSVALLMSGIAAVSAALWVWYAAYQWPKGDIMVEGSVAEEEQRGLLRRESSTGQQTDGLP